MRTNTRQSPKGYRAPTAQVSPPAPQFLARLRTMVLPYALLLPSLVFVVGFTIWPLALTLWRSLYRQNAAVREPVFVGLGNFAQLAQDSDFRQVLGNTLAFTVMTVPVSLLLALCLALLLTPWLRGGFVRTALFYPAVIPLISVGTIWLFIYNPTFGLMNSLLGVIGIPPQNWLGNRWLVLPALAILEIWKQTGLLMIFYLAALQRLPREYTEAAQLDGASFFQALRLVVWPLLRGTTLLISTLAAISSIQTVDYIYIMTEGGPNNASNMLLYNLYDTAFRFKDVGLGYAQTVVLLVVMLAFTSVNVLVMERFNGAR